MYRFARGLCKGKRGHAGAVEKYEAWQAMPAGNWCNQPPLTKDAEATAYTQRMRECEAAI